MQCLHEYWDGSRKKENMSLTKKHQVFVVSDLIG